jgi:predicted enzyme related to lactoylglutathione lyase
MNGLAGVILWTDNLERLVVFYRDILGLAVHSYRPHFVAFKFGDVRLSIGLHDNVTGFAKDPYRIMVNLITMDIQKDYEHLKASGVELLRAPEKEHWGGWVITFFDPDGNILQLFQQPVAQA